VLVSTIWCCGIQEEFKPKLRLIRGRK